MDQIWPFPLHFLSLSAISNRYMPNLFNQSSTSLSLCHIVHFVVSLCYVDHTLTLDHSSHVAFLICLLFAFYSSAKFLIILFSYEIWSLIFIQINLIILIFIKDVFNICINFINFIINVIINYKITFIINIIFLLLLILLIVFIN